jgi:hypothetical protein
VAHIPDCPVSTDRPGSSSGSGSISGNNDNRIVDIVLIARSTCSDGVHLGPGSNSGSILPGNCFIIFKPNGDDRPDDDNKAGSLGSNIDVCCVSCCISYVSASACGDNRDRRTLRDRPLRPDSSFNVDVSPIAGDCPTIIADDSGGCHFSRPLFDRPLRLFRYTRFLCTSSLTR